MSVLRRLVNLARGTVLARSRRDAPRDPDEDPAPPPPPPPDGSAGDASGTDERTPHIPRKRRL